MHATDPVNRAMSAPVISIAPDAPVRQVLQLLLAHPIHHLPVVDRNETLIGIVTTTDLMRWCLNPPPDVPPSVFNALKAPPLADERVNSAIASARRAVATNHDPYGIAATLLLIEQRVQALQAVALAAKRYINAGQDERLHVALAKAIERADRFDEATRHPAMLDLC